MNKKSSQRAWKHCRCCCICKLPIEKYACFASSQCKKLVLAAKSMLHSFLFSMEAAKYKKALAYIVSKHKRCMAVRLKGCKKWY